MARETKFFPITADRRRYWKVTSPRAGPGKLSVPAAENRIRRHENIAWDIGKFQVAGDHGHDCGLNAAAVEGVCLDHKHGAPMSRLGATRLWEIGPPDLSSLNPRPFLPGVLFEGFQLGAMQCGIHLRGSARIHFIQAFGNRVTLLPVQELRNRRNVQLTSRNPEATGSSFRQTEKVVGYRDGGLHVHSITRVIPGRRLVLVA